jgi:hypothetical protein
MLAGCAPRKNVKKPTTSWHWHQKWRDSAIEIQGVYVSCKLISLRRRPRRCAGSRFGGRSSCAVNTVTTEQALADDDHGAALDEDENDVAVYSGEKPEE